MRKPIVLALLCVLSAVAHAGNITLYRGVRVPPNKFKTTGGRGSDERDSTAGRTWFAEKLAEAEGYTRGGTHKFKTVVEISIPLKFYDYARSFGTLADAHRWGQHTGTVSRKNIPDLKPFIKRIGLRAGDTTKWFTWKQAERAGLFDEKADYARMGW